MVLRAKFLETLAAALARVQLVLSGSTTTLGAPSTQRTFLADLRKKAWVVYAKRPFAGPGQVLEHIGLEPLEFLRRFALHILPRGFNRIRHYGLLANRNKRALLAKARMALDTPASACTDTPAQSVAAFWQRLAGIDIARCTHCGLGTLRFLATLAPPPRPPP